MTIPLGPFWWYLPKPLSEHVPYCENDQHAGLLDEVERVTERAEKAEAEVTRLRQLRCGCCGAARTVRQQGGE